jgi:hypothetical protein
MFSGRHMPFVCPWALASLPNSFDLFMRYIILQIVLHFEEDRSSEERSCQAGEGCCNLGFRFTPPYRLIEKFLILCKQIKDIIED